MMASIDERLQLSSLGRDTEKLVLSKALKLVFNDRVFIQDNRTVIL